MGVRGGAWLAAILELVNKRKLTQTYCSRKGNVLLRRIETPSQVTRQCPSCVSRPTGLENGTIWLAAFLSPPCSLCILHLLTIFLPPVEQLPLGHMVLRRHSCHPRKNQPLSLDPTFTKYSRSRTWLDYLESGAQPGTCQPSQDSGVPELHLGGRLTEFRGTPSISSGLDASCLKSHSGSGLCSAHLL